MFSLFRTLMPSRSGVAARFLAALSFLVGLILTQNIQLSRRLYAVARQGRFKDALHLAEWYLRLCYKGILKRPYKYFDFAAGFSDADLEAADRFIAKNTKSVDDVSALTDRLTVEAHRIQLDIIATGTSLRFGRYEALANAALGVDHRANPQGALQQNQHFTQADAAVALVDFKSLMRDARTPWYVISGTFLGLVREGGFLDHDYDIDVGVNAPEFDFARLRYAVLSDPAFAIVDRNIQRRIEINGDRMHEETSEAMVKLLHVTGVSIDVFVHHLAGDISWHGSALHRWDNSAFDLAPYDLAGVSVDGPADADRYLTENYGNWRVPVTSFDCSTGTPNVSFVRHLAVATLFLKRYIHDHDKAQRIAGLILQQEGYLRENDTAFVIPWAQDET